MSTDTVSIGCRLPNGLTLEVGFTVNVRGAGGAPYARFQKHADYQAVTLKGTNQHLILRDAQGKPLVTLANARDKEPFVNHGISKDFWERWCKENAHNWALRSGQIFAVPKPDAATVKAVAADAKAQSAAILEPLDTSVPFKAEGNALEKRKDDE